MGFLSGVLGAVKDDEAVKTYDIHPQNNFTKAIETIKKNMYKTGGLSEAVTAVSTALGAWDREVTSRTNSVKILSKSLTQHYINILVNSLHELNICSASDVASKLQVCFKEAEKLNNAFRDAEIQCMSLDNGLQEMIKGNMNSMKVRVKEFVGAANNTELKATVEFTKTRSEELKQAVNSYVKQRVSSMRSNIESEFNKKIHQPMLDVVDRLKGLNSQLDTWIQKAEAVVTKAINQCTNIVKVLKCEEELDRNRTKRQAVETAATNLKEKADALRIAVISAQGELRSRVKTALKQVLILDRAVKMELNELKNRIQMGIGKYVKSIIRDIEVTVNNITGTKGTDGGLKKVVEQVTSWASDFKTTEGFEGKVKDWILHILSDNDFVSEKVTAYGKKLKQLRQGKFTSLGYMDAQGDAENSQYHQEIAEFIKNKLKTDIGAGSQMVQGSLEHDGQGTEQIEKYLHAVGLGCSQFADAIEATIMTKERTIDTPLSTGIYNFAGEIAKDLESELQVMNNSNQSLLQSAVHRILHELLAVAKQTAYDLGWLTSKGDKQGNIQNVAAALSIAKRVETDLNSALNAVVDVSSATFASGEPYKASDNIDRRVSGILDGHLPNGSGGQVKIDSVKFSYYERQIKQATITQANDGEPDPLDGEFPQVIKAIRDNVNGDHHLQRVVNSQAPSTVMNDGKFYNNTFVLLLQQVNDTMQAFCDAVKDLVEKNDKTNTGPNVDENRGVQRLLEDLQIMLNKGADGNRLYELPRHLRDIHEEIKTTIIGTPGSHASSPQTLEHILDAAASFYHKLNTETEQTISEIKTVVTDETDAATEAIQNKARSSYHKKISKMLKYMKSSFETQIENIEKIIDKNLMSGVKGLLRNTKRYFDTNTEQLISQNISSLSINVNVFIARLMSYVVEQTKGHDISNQVKSLSLVCQNMLNELHNSQHFDYKFGTNINNINDRIDSLTPSTLDPQALPDAGRPVLRALREGMLGFVGELGKVYVNKYDGGEGIKKWVKQEGGKDVLTPEGKNGAKVFLTLLEMVNEDLGHLKNECERDWGKFKIYEQDNESTNPLGSFLKRCGFKVAERDTSKDGELRLPLSGFSGDHITKLELFTSIPHTNASKFLVNLDSLITHLNQYNQVGHLRHVKSPRNPCSIFEMLVWSYGLQHNGVYDELVKYCHKYDTSYDKKPDAEFKKRLTDTVDYSLRALSDYSRNILTTILGTGDEYTTYAVDYSDNSLNLKYPASGEDCLHTLLDILRRLLPTLRFLNNQCKLKTKDNGWYECEYGMYTAPAKWPCTAHSSDKATSQPNTQPKCQPTCKVNSQANCQPTSPLQSYLNDCLPGHLPHRLIDVGCKSECKTCSPSTSGMPCVTPLGFKAFSCSTRRGEDICAVLSKFFNVAKLSPLFCLAPKPPSTLPEHMEFALALVKDWDSDATHPLKNSIHSTIRGASIELCGKPEVLTTALTNAYGSYYGSHDTCDDQHISSLTRWDACPAQNKRCAPYLQSLCYDYYSYLVKKHCNLYLSWAVYLPWDFWTQLNNMCNAFSNISCQDWGCRECLRADKCKRGEHGLSVKKDDESEEPNCRCPSIISCKSVSPMLYSYGLTFGHPTKILTNKKCNDFYNQLHSVLNSKYFIDLLTKCDEYLRDIRWPFMLTVLTLWLLSFLYLIHIMVIRLDLLHIKSHLHSPSSHRIAAQSLLAAGRVNKLNRVFYLQP
ncbi:hypothetical protein BBBOND_0300050 [Babesia bigemina]|uniref:C3H1-type domain-containing protein n=1 Tax=Babesia bigemina TaxID=5866 RepID=A0A061DDA4_BABBI|nr:hypothetical protein BBBOND_0300050 [Babesia bigemina]CDR96100.1 hypothetical protein BBBOND_0300050 [Babesia bigemina]|eukprot:XP_012768286.1 hypothetical protein BBBOND_0300050 [Babesia bigemina]